MKKKNSILQIGRLVLQIVFFIFLPSLYVGAFGGIKQIYLAVLHQSFSAGLLPQLVEVLATIPITIVLGRFFCGWMCAFGSFTDFIYRISQKVFHKKWKISEKNDAWMKKVKYAVLLFLIVFSWSLNAAVIGTASPWDVFGLLATVGKAPDFSYVAANLLPGFVLFLAVIAVSAFSERFFCRYLCPMGAIFSVASLLRIAKIKKPSSQCGSCRACTNSCAMGIPLYKMEEVRSGECINCMKCVAVCPRGNAKLQIARNDVRPLVAGIGTIAAISGIYYGSGLLMTDSPVQNASAVSQSGQSGQSANRLYQDGTYQGSGSGFRGATTTVSVTVSGDKITEITVDSYGDDERFFSRAYSQISQEIISSQSADVDAVSGATFSSNGIMQAVSSALEQAKTKNTVVSAVYGTASSGT